MLDPQGELPVPASPWGWEPTGEGSVGGLSVTPWQHSMDRAAGGKD